MAEEKGLQSLVSPRSRTVRGEEERMLEAQRLRREQLESLYKEDVQTPGQIAEDIYGAVKGMDTMDQIALGTAVIPIVGDIAGGIADTRTLINEPSLKNLGFLLAGLVPFVPSGGVIKAGRGAYKAAAQKAAVNLRNDIPGFYGKGIGKAGQVAAFAKTIPEALVNTGLARYDPASRGKQITFNLSPADVRANKKALEVSEKETAILKPLEERRKVMIADGSAHTGKTRVIPSGKNKGKVVPVETEEFINLSADIKASRSRANTAGKIAMGQIAQSKNLTKQFFGESGLQGILKNTNKVDGIKSFKTLSEGDYFETVGDLIPTQIGREGVDQIFKQIKNVQKYNPKKNTQMDIRRVHTGSAGELDPGMSARMYPSSGIGKDGMASLSDMKKEIFSKPIGGESKGFESRTYKTNEDFLKRLDEKGIKILNRDEMVRGIEEGRNVPAIITGSAKTDAYDIGGANYMTAISKDGKSVTVMNDQHDMLGQTIPGTDRLFTISEPIVLDLGGNKAMTKVQTKAKTKLKDQKDMASKEALEDYTKIPGVDISGPLPVGFKTKEQWARAQAVVLSTADKDYSRLIKEATIATPTRVARATRDREEEEEYNPLRVTIRPGPNASSTKKGGGSVIERNPYGYPPRAI